MMMFRVFILLVLTSSFALASFLTDSATMSYSIRSMGRGGAEVAEPYGADSLTSNPAGLSQSGSGLHFNNLDYSNAYYSHKQSTIFHRKSFGVGVWKAQANDEVLDTFGLGIARRNRNGVDWGLAYKSHTYSNALNSQTLWSTDLGVLIHMSPAFDIGFVGKDILGQEGREISPSFQSGIV